MNATDPFAYSPLVARALHNEMGINQGDVIDVGDNAPTLSHREQVLVEVPIDLCSLTYGEMMEFAEGIMRQTTEKPTDAANSLAALIHRWAVRNRQQLVTDR